MIKIFRKIRQRLLADLSAGKEGNKFSRYMIYAFGEIFLVVIGILIALQINNWNEGRKENKQEHLYLQRLLLENQQDILTFTKSIEDLETGNQSIKDMANALNDVHSADSTLLKSIADYLTFGCHYPFFNPSTSTFEDLSSTGNLGVIEDTELRDLIVSHYANYKFTNANFQVSTNWALPIDAPFYIDNDVLKFEPISAFIFGTGPNELSTIEIRNNRETYIRNAAVHYWVNADCISLLNGVKDETTNLVNRLKKEIKKH